MGLILGEYDAKKEGFDIGGFSIHNNMTAHGPDEKAFEQASHQPLKPDYYANTLAFMFESCNIWQVTEKAYHHQTRQRDYTTCWQNLKNRFTHPDIS